MNGGEPETNALFWTMAGLFVVVLVLMPIYSLYAGRRVSDTRKNLKGLNLPEGSIRGMLALMSVGSFIAVLVLGPGVGTMKEHFDQVITAFGTLTGAVIGFYFGNRGTTSSNTETLPSDAKPTSGPSENDDKGPSSN